MSVQLEVVKPTALFYPSETTLQVTLIERMNSLVLQFQRQEGQWITPNCQLIKEGHIHYYGIHKDHQYQTSQSETRCLYQTLKSHILQHMNLSANTDVIQVVGDSASFSPEGTEKAKFFLKNHLSSDSAVLYGYTGHSEPDGTRCVNAAVTDVICEKNMQDKVIANLVGFHTPTALSQWGCTGPALQHYVIVYGDDESCREKGTVFGDDVVSSDYFADQLLMLDGGAQSFRQACHALLLNQKITILPDLRAISKAYKTEMTGEEGQPREVKTPYFNASHFLQEVADLIARENSNEECLQVWYEGYFGIGKCYIGDPNRGDFDTKQKLMDDAWKLFIESKLYLKISTLIAPLV